MPKAAPVLARVLRGGRTESLHRGDLAVVDESGKVLASTGDASRPIFLRSAAKPFQAMPLLEAGGAERFRLTAAELALICASHGGQPRHVRVAGRLLEKGGFTERDLVCGAHLPMHEPTAGAMLRRGERPTRLHNNCSGKHAGLLLACRLLRLPARGYWKPSHPLQRAIRRRISQLASFPESRMETGVDGCGLAVFTMPLSALALAYARLLATTIAGESRGQAAARGQIVRAMWQRPDMVAGTGFFTTRLLEAGDRRWIGKEGAEGVYAIGVRAASRRGKASGIALKIEDGSARARPLVTLAVLREMGWSTRRSRRALASFEAPPVTNAAGAVVGSIEAEVPIIHRHASR